jgi:hypothetical protein
MGNDEEDLLAFLQGFGFSEEELNCVLDELNAYRSIPGTTIGRYMNRVINTLVEEERTAFLKGISHQGGCECSGRIRFDR